MSEVEERHRGKATQNRVERGQVSRARQEVTGALRGQRKRPQERRKERGSSGIRPRRQVELSLKKFANCGTPHPEVHQDQAGVPTRWLRLLLEDNESLLHFHATAEDFARADVPASIFKAFHMANMTAL